MTATSEQRRIAEFTSEKARDRFLEAYDAALDLWPLPRREIDVETGFGVTRVHRGGTDHGDPIVLLHGSAGNASNWYLQVGALGRDHPVYAVDGIDDPGGSVQRAAINGPADYAAWLAQVLDGLGLDRVHLVGHSHGGYLTLNQAVRAPETLATITLLDPAGLEKVPVRFYLHVLAGLPALAAPRRMRQWLARRMANPALVAPPDMQRTVMLAARTFRLTRPAAPRLSDEELRSIATPAYFLLAERSSLLRPRRASARVHALLPSARVEVMRVVGHGLTLEEPEQVNERILGFIDG